MSSSDFELNCTNCCIGAFKDNLCKGCHTKGTFWNKYKFIGDEDDFIEAVNISELNNLRKLRKEISEYGSIWVEYTIDDKTDKGIERLIEDVLRQAKNSVLEIIDKHLEAFEK